MLNTINQLPIIDSHLHLWDIGRLSYPWLNEVLPIKKTFLAGDYQQQTISFTIEKMVFVQCECLPQQCLNEVQFVMEQMAADPRIKGIVAYAPMEQGIAVKQILDILAANKFVKGIRRMYDDDPAICCSSPFIEALNLLPSYGFSFDVSIQPHAVQHTIKMIQHCPDTLFIIDHLAKPDIRNNALEQFKKDINALAAFPNTVAKISGLPVETDMSNWNAETVIPYILFALNSFGEDRLMFGGDWPVVTLAGTYQKWISAVMEALLQCDMNTQQKIFYSNAEKFYKLC